MYPQWVPNSSQSDLYYKQWVSFIAALSMAALALKKPACARTSHNSQNALDNNINALYNVIW